MKLFPPAVGTSISPRPKPLNRSDSIDSCQQSLKSYVYCPFLLRSLFLPTSSAMFDILNVPCVQMNAFNGVKQSSMYFRQFLDIAKQFIELYWSFIHDKTSLIKPGLKYPNWLMLYIFGQTLQPYCLEKNAPGFSNENAFLSSSNASLRLDEILNQCVVASNCSRNNFPSGKASY